MSESLGFKERFFNWIYANPTIAQWWAKLTAGRTGALVDLSGDIPFAHMRKPLATARGALITTGGVHLPDQPPFDMENPDGDASYRMIPGDAAFDSLTITHKYYNHSDADEDLNVMFPLALFRELTAQGVIGGVAPRHFGFMGHIEGEQIPILNQTTAPEVAAKLRADGVDFAFLTPA